MSAACAFRRWLKLSSAYRPRSLDDVGLGAIAKASEMIGVFIWAANMPQRDPFPKDFNEFKARIKITCILRRHLCNFRFTNVSLLGQKDCCLTEICKPLILNWSATLSDICTSQKTATFPSQPARLSHRHRLQPPATLVPSLVPSNWADLFAEDVQPCQPAIAYPKRRLPHPSMAFGMGATNPPCLQFSQRHQAPQGVLEDKTPWENIQKIWKSLCHDNFRGLLDGLITFDCSRQPNIIE